MKNNIEKLNKNARKNVEARINSARDCRAITLIALIITIIVLLILAGVVLNFVIGENGILKHAEFASNKYQNSAEKEENELAKIDSYIEGNRDTITIDKAEYQKLLDSVEKNNNANNFSEEEKEIGTWINGKKLYMKTIVLETTSDILQEYDHNIKDVDTIFIDAGNTFFLQNNNKICLFFNTGIWRSSDSSTNMDNDYLIFIQNVTKTKITIRAGINSDGAKAYITLKYTKTTD